MGNDFGVVYVAAGEKFVREAVQSAESVRAAMPRLPLAIWTDEASLAPHGLFDEVGELEEPTYSFFDKIGPLLETPFEKTLFLDTDTLLIQPVWELAELLDRFELAYCHAPYRSVYDMPQCPAAFAEPNTGVILYRRTTAVCDVFCSWATIYRRQLKLNPPPMHDQPAFRQAVYQSRVSSTILPCEYNLRTIFPYFAGGNLPVKILHGREPSLSEVRRTINNGSAPRVGDATAGKKGLARIAGKLSRKAQQFHNRWRRAA